MDSMKNITHDVVESAKEIGTMTKLMAEEKMDTIKQQIRQEKIADSVHDLEMRYESVKDSIREMF